MANRRGGNRGGRKPKPTTLKIASGMRPDRASIAEPKAPAGAPPCPAEFDAYERLGWDAFLRDVDKLGLLSVVDGHAAAVYATAYGRGRHFDDDIRKRGVMVEGAHGGVVVNPSVAGKERCERMMLSTLSLYGLTPSDRSRLKATDQSEVDPFEAYIKAKTS